MRLDLPSVVLWAWERPEDLRFLDCSRTGVAYLAGTLFLGADGVRLRPRMQPLQVPPGCPMLAVIRLESDRGGAATLSESQRLRAAEAILQPIPPSVRGLQIDFDAVVSERPFYGALLEDLRRLMPPNWPLSITALASWCLEDDWMRGLPVDEAVPMLFRMGLDERRVRHELAAGRDFALQVARSSYGLSSDEPMPPLRKGRRVYLFHPRVWDRFAFDQVLRTVAISFSEGQALP